MNVDRVLHWSDQHWVLARLVLAMAAAVLGAFLVEVVGVDGVKPGQFEGRPVVGLIVYGMVGFGGGIVLGSFAAIAGVTLAMLWHVIRWVIRLPRQALDWAERIGGRGIAGYVLVALDVTLMLVVLAALGDFRGDGMTFWIDVFFNGALAALFGGAVGALALVIVVKWLRDLFARRLPDPTDHWPTLRILLLIGYLVGASALWQWWNPVGHVFAASSADMDWVTVPVAFGVIHGYAALAMVVGAATKWLRGRALLLPEIAPESLVWHQGGPVPRRPREVHWSPDAVMAWRGWHVSEGRLVGHYQQPWQSSSHTFVCRTGHLAPDWRCNCGIYALKNPEEVSGAVVGLVALEGIVIEHEDGYRAEQARIVALWVPDETVHGLVSRGYPDVEVRIGRPVRTDVG